MGDELKQSGNQGSLDQAIANGRAMLTNRRPELAVLQAHAILAKLPQHPPTLRLAAAAHRALGENAKAEEAELAAIEFSTQDPALVQASAALMNEDFDRASQITEDHLEKNRDDLAALALRAEALLGRGDANAAEEILLHVLERAPNFAAARILLANALIARLELKKARTILLEVLEKLPENIRGLRALCTVEFDLGNLERVSEIEKKMLRITPEDVNLRLRHGRTLRYMGKKQEAIAIYRDVLRFDGYDSLAWWSLADIDASKISDDDVERMMHGLEHASGDTPRETNLASALGIAMNARGQYEAAFKSFARANALRELDPPYDPEILSNTVTRYIDRCDTKAIRSPITRSNTAAAPIFIIGMPRSGSTLLERILGGHSAIAPLGELPFGPRMTERVSTKYGDDDFANCVLNLETEELQELGEWYRDFIRDRITNSCQYFTDKLPMNWGHLPLLLRALPDAKVIDIRRDALDCCWSNFRTQFGAGHPASSDLYAIGRFYKDYVRLSDHMRKIAPDRILLVNYQALVEQLEEETRRTCDFLQIEFEPHMVDFHLSDAPVATASSEQVRRPINRDGFGVADPYLQWLSPLREALGSLATR